MYNEKVIEYFKNPRNMGEIKDADGIGKVGNPVCGDLMWMYIKIGKNTKGEEIIEDIKFKTFGCVAAIATSSMVTELAKGMALKEVEKIKSEDVVKSLGGLPSAKLHCAAMAVSALKAAIADYRSSSSTRNSKVSK